MRRRQLAGRASRDAPDRRRVRSAPRVSASTRYVLWWVAMILVLLLPACRRSSRCRARHRFQWPPRAALTLPLPMFRRSAPLLLSAAGCSGLPRFSPGCPCPSRASASFAGTASFPPGREGRLRHWVAVGCQRRSPRLRPVSRVSSASVIGLGPADCSVAGGSQRLTDDELDQVVLRVGARVQRRDDTHGSFSWPSLHLRPASCLWWISRRRIERDRRDDYAVNITGGAQASLCLTKPRLHRVRRRRRGAWCSSHPS